MKIRESRQGQKEKNGSQKEGIGGEERDKVNERERKERGTQRVGSDPAINPWLMQTRLVKILIKALFMEPQAKLMKPRMDTLYPGCPLQARSVSGKGDSGHLQSIAARKRPFMGSGTQHSLLSWKEASLWNAHLHLLHTHHLHLLLMASISQTQLEPEGITVC